MVLLRKILAVVLALGSLVMFGLVVGEMLSSSKPSSPGSTNSVVGVTTVSTTPTTQPTPLCSAIQESQRIYLSRGGRDESEVLSGVLEVMPEYVESLKVVLQEAQNSSLPDEEIDFLKLALQESSAILSSIYGIPLEDARAKLAASQISSRVLSVETPTLYAMAVSACRAEIGLRVQ
jgi:hypothetical protein